MVKSQPVSRFLPFFGHTVLRVLRDCF
uniref:Uncharacterized protein n=1 Tax=Anguilla anguilla TaxID=7936 RepID=A0A0E9STD1_ANGAN